MTTRYALLHFCPDLTDPNAESFPAALLLTVETPSHWIAGIEFWGDSRVSKFDQGLFQSIYEAFLQRNTDAEPLLRFCRISRGSYTLKLVEDPDLKALKSPFPTRIWLKAFPKAH